MKATILLIDDYRGIRDLLGHTLRLRGYAVTVASNGQEALNSLRKTGFDLVLLDFDMAVSNGWDTLGQIITTSLSLPLILITGHPNDEHLAMQKGITAVLEKPLDVALLLEVVERALAETSQAPRKDTGPDSP
jgi:DNA-binding NtrC family response regulator